MNPSETLGLCFNCLICSSIHNRLLLLLQVMSFMVRQFDMTMLVFDWIANTNSFRATIVKFFLSCGANQVYLRIRVRSHQKELIK